VPEAVDDAQGAVAIGHTVDQDTQGHKVVDLAEALALGRVFLRLLVNAVDVLGSPLDLGLYPILRQFLAHDLLHLGDVAIPGNALGSQEAGYLIVALGVQVLEREVL
jgi:hypothetical protein